MIVEKRFHGTEKKLILIPSPEEASIIDEVLGCNIQTSDGLIANLVGHLSVADGYGPAYISLKVAPPEKTG